MDLDYKKKYLKYKAKYLQLKGGVWHRPPVGEETANHSLQDDEKLPEECPVCIETKSLNTKLIPCWHHMCSDCYERLNTTGHRICPICRRRIDGYFNIVNNMWIKNEEEERQRQRREQEERQRRMEQEQRQRQRRMEQEQRQRPHLTEEELQRRMEHNRRQLAEDQRQLDEHRHRLLEREERHHREVQELRQRRMEQEQRQREVREENWRQHGVDPGEFERRHRESEEENLRIELQEYIVSHRQRGIVLEVSERVLREGDVERIRRHVELLRRAEEDDLLPREERLLRRTRAFSHPHPPGDPQEWNIL